MIGALEALRAVRSRINSTAGDRDAQISNPIGIMRFFSTHPPAEERIARLRANLNADRCATDEEAAGSTGDLLAFGLSESGSRARRTARASRCSGCGRS